MKIMRGWIIASWIALVGVMAGGGLMLRRLTAGGVTHDQLEWVRDGHAHGGVLILMSLVYYWFMEGAQLPNWLKHTACLILFLGIAVQAGGFFLHGFAPAFAGAGTDLTLSSAGLLAGSISILILGLLRKPFWPH